MTRIVLSVIASRTCSAGTWPILVDRQEGDLEAVALEPLARVDDRLVLGRRVMMWLPFLRYIAATPLMARLLLSVAPQVKMISLAFSSPPLDAGADQAGDLVAGLFDRLLRLPAERVIAAGGVAVILGEVRQHRLHHPRIAARRGVVVHVDRQLQAHWFGIHFPYLDAER